jgi:hypothetical protein
MKYDKDFLKQLFNPIHLSTTPSTVAMSKEEIKRKRKNFNLNKEIKNKDLRNFLGLSNQPLDSKKPISTDSKNADKDAMNYMEPKQYISTLSHGSKVQSAPLDKVMKDYTNTKFPTKVINPHIVLNKVHNMPDWIQELVNKLHKDGINYTGKVPSSPNTVVKKTVLGNETLFYHVLPDGTIRIDVQSPYAAYPNKISKMGVYSMTYTPPATHTDPKTNIIMTTPAEFKFFESRHQIDGSLKEKEVHFNNRISDTTPLESKITKVPLHILRREQGVKPGRNINPDVLADLHSQTYTINHK